MLPSSVAWRPGNPRMPLDDVVGCSSTTDDSAAANEAARNNDLPPVFGARVFAAPSEPSCRGLIEQPASTAPPSSWQPHVFTTSQCALDQQSSSFTHNHSQQHQHQHHQHQQQQQHQLHHQQQQLQHQQQQQHQYPALYLPGAKSLQGWPGGPAPATLVTLASGVASAVFPFAFGAAATGGAGAAAHPGSAFAQVQPAAAAAAAQSHQPPPFLQSLAPVQVYAAAAAAAASAAATAAGQWPAGHSVGVYAACGSDLLRTFHPSGGLSGLHPEPCVPTAGALAGSSSGQQQQQQQQQQQMLQQQLAGLLLPAQQPQHPTQPHPQLLRQTPQAVPYLVTPLPSCCCLNPHAQSRMEVAASQQHPQQQHHHQQQQQHLSAAAIAPSLQPPTRQQPQPSQPQQLLLLQYQPPAAQPRVSTWKHQMHQLGAPAAAAGDQRPTAVHHHHLASRRVRPPSPTPPCAPLTPPLPSAAGPEDWILHAIKVLGMGEPDTGRLALHCWRRVGALPQLHHASRLWPSAVAGRNLYATACLWVSIKLEEKRRAAPGGRVLALMAATTPATLCSAELAVMNWLQWRPYDGYRLDESHLLVYM